MKEKFSVKINIETSNITSLNIMKWLEKAPFFEVVSFQADDIKKYKKPTDWQIVNLDQVLMDIRKVKYPIFFTLKDGYDNSLLIGMRENFSFLLFSIYVLQGSDLQDWIEYTQSFFEIGNIGVVACFYPEDDLFWQRNVDPGQYKLYGKSLDGLTLRPFNKVSSLIDVSSLPGYPNEFDNLWFGSTWKMIYGEKYFQFLSREKLLSYPNAYAVEQLKNQAISITLFEDYKHYCTDEARYIQREFRNYMEIDQIVDALKKTR